MMEKHFTIISERASAGGSQNVQVTGLKSFTSPMNTHHERLQNAALTYAISPFKALPKGSTTSLGWRDVKTTISSETVLFRH
jgi:hypothetical protein